MKRRMIAGWLVGLFTTAKIVAIVAVTTIMALAPTGVALGDAPQRGSVRVVARTTSGDAVSGLSVTLTSTDSRAQRSVVSGSLGVATFVGLDPSPTWSLECASSNRNIAVGAGTTTVVYVIRDGDRCAFQTSPFEFGLATRGSALTAERFDTLPTPRDHSTLLTLTPGVYPDSFDAPGNPASRSGFNYNVVGGEVGISRDNLYFIDGIPVTDPLTGRLAAALWTDVIEEQTVLTGGLPARYASEPGLLSSVVTRSGGNAFRGSLSYFLHDDGLASADDNRDDPTFSVDDIGLTLEGPIVQDRLWFFAAYRNLSRDDDVLALDTGSFLRTVANDQDQFLGKLTFQLTKNDRFTGSFLGDPQDVSGLTNRDLLNSRDIAQELGGNRFALGYTRVFSSGFLDVALTEHRAESNVLPAIGEIRNDVIFLPGTSTLAQQQLGGAGNIDTDERDIEGYHATLDWLLDTSWGQHTLRGGFEYQEQTHFRDRQFVGGAQYTSLDSTLSGSDANFIANTSLTGNLQFDVTNTSDFNGFLNSIDTSANRAAFYALLDTDSNGTITQAEAGTALIFDSTAGNPNGLVNYDRDIQSADGPQETRSEGTVLFIEDTWQLGRWSANVGVRAEEWKHVATSGEEIFTFDTEYAPRVSVAYDVHGDGRSRISAFYGRYMTPPRMNLTNFAGTLIGRETQEQVFVSGGGIDEFVTYRTRGGVTTQDALFAPTTKTPYTDEWTLGYQRDLGGHMSVEATYFKREARDLIEDYDLERYAYATPSLAACSPMCTDYPGDIAHPDSLWLGLEYFGFRDAMGAPINPGGNFVLATLAGGERDHEGFELVFRKRLHRGWQAQAAYTYADAEGNTDSDTNSGFQGDILFLDPRAPNRHGAQPGSIEHLVRIDGSYAWDFGLTLGARFVWNSGTIASRTFTASRRNLPLRVDSANAFEFAGITDRWIAPGSVGSLTNPSWSSTDLRLQYNRSWDRIAGTLFLDVFNVLDDQAVIRREDLVFSYFTAFNEPIRWVPPRRVFLGVRLSFE